MAATGCIPVEKKYNKGIVFLRGTFMKDFSSWFRSFRARMRGGLYRFMTGRYGTDRLNVVILCVGVAFSILSAFLQQSWAGSIFWLLSYGLMIWAIFRCMSRNINKRYQENRRFLLMIDRVKDRKNRYFLCPRCRQTVRVPRHKGKILITCPKCKERFQRRT